MKLLQSDVNEETIKADKKELAVEENLTMKDLEGTYFIHVNLSRRKISANE